MAESTLHYFEDLSAIGITCPHEDALMPDGKHEYFRVLKENPATSDSFLPTKIKEDSRIIPDACIQKSVSIFDNLEGLISGYFKTPAHKKKKRMVGVLHLRAADGVLKQTFAAGHHSWWRSQSFSPEGVIIKMVEA